MPDPGNWLIVFLRASGFILVFPVFSATHIPTRVRVALAALLGLLVAPVLPAAPLAGADFWGAAGVMAVEVGSGLLLGFAGRLMFYALDIAGGIISAEIGLNLPTSLNPMSAGQTTEIGTVLHYLGGVLFLALNLHHELLLAFRRSYHFLPAGGAGGVSEPLALEIIGRTGHLFAFAVQMAAPIIAVSFIITLVFSVLSRAVPQMNVFTESWAVRILGGLAVFGLTCHLFGAHIANFLRRLPEDMLRVAQLLGGG
jgi:flagellar biosynthetic protein FliR